MVEIGKGIGDQWRTDRVLRGGSWNNKPENCRAANRNRNEPDNRNNNNGFRCARTFLQSRAGRFTEGPGDLFVHAAGSCGVDYERKDGHPGRRTNIKTVRGRLVAQANASPGRPMGAVCWRGSCTPVPE